MGTGKFANMKKDDVAVVVYDDSHWLEMHDGNLGLIRQVVESVTTTTDGGNIVMRGADWSQILVEVRGHVPAALRYWIGKPLDIYFRRGEDGPWTDAHMIGMSIEIMPRREPRHQPA